MYIYDIDGNFTLPNNWNTANNNKAVGVAILSDDCKFVVAKEDIGANTWGGYGVDISGLTNYDYNNVATDFDGVNNTSKIIAALGSSNAAGDCAAYVFPNGKTGYLGAAGEFQVAGQNQDDLNSVLTLIGGTEMSYNIYWTSTETNEHLAWYYLFDDSNSDLNYYNKEGDFSIYAVRAFLALEIKPLKERITDLESNKADKSSLATVATSGSYNDLSNKPTIPSAVTESTVSGWGFTKNQGDYTKPTDGIPKDDLSSGVQASLDKADTALQSHQDISGKQDKLVSGTNIKTINGTSILGSGNIVIEGGGVTEEYVNNAISSAITTTLNTAV